MGHNMMRKDGDAHMAERAAMFPAVSPRTVSDTWSKQFQAHADRILDELAPTGRADLCKAFALPLSAECLKDITGLTNMRYQDMDAWSQAMIDGIANYTGDKRGRGALPRRDRRHRRRDRRHDPGGDETSEHVDPQRAARRGPADGQHPRQHQARDIGRAERAARRHLRHGLGAADASRSARAGAAGKAKWLDVFEEYARWIAPIGMSPRRVAKPWSYGGVDFEPEDRVFFMFGSANRDEACFADPDSFDVTRDTQKSIAFGAGPHYCAGAFASRAMVADVALPGVFARLKGLRLDRREPVRIGGWAFRGLLNLPVDVGCAIERQIEELEPRA